MIWLDGWKTVIALDCLPRCSLCVKWSDLIEVIGQMLIIVGGLCMPQVILAFWLYLCLCSCVCVGERRMFVWNVTRNLFKLSTAEMWSGLHRGDQKIHKIAFKIGWCFKVKLPSLLYIPYITNHNRPCQVFDMVINHVYPHIFRPTSEVFILSQFSAYFGLQ